MFSYLGLTSNPDYMAFAAMCEDAHEPSGLASGMAGSNHMGPPAVVQFEVSTAGVDIPHGAVVQACGSWNSWCTPNPGERPMDPHRPGGHSAEPLTLNADAGFVTHVDTYMGQLTLPPGTCKKMTLSRFDRACRLANRKVSPFQTRTSTGSSRILRTQKTTHGRMCPRPAASPGRKASTAS